jgi:hypothetical protein
MRGTSPAYNAVRICKYTEETAYINTHNDTKQRSVDTGNRCSESFLPIPPVSCNGLPAMISPKIERMMIFIPDIELVSIPSDTMWLASSIQIFLFEGLIE